MKLRYFFVILVFTTGSSNAFLYEVPQELSESFSNYGNSVAYAGDVNGDGYSDILVGANDGYYKVWLYYGNPNGINISGVDITSTLDTRVGYALSTAGDVNNDGYDDVVIGAHFNSSAYLFYGSSNGINTTPITLGVDITPYFGRSLSHGDVNGDGYSDIIVGSSTEKVFIFYGGGIGINLSYQELYRNVSGSGFGQKVSSKGDVNNDEYSDMIVSCGTNRVCIFYGNATGIVDSPLELVGGSGFGIALSYAGDVNNDHIGDVIIGAPTWASGDIYLFYGSPSGLNTSRQEIQGSGMAYFGYDVSYAGDLNNDGIADVMVNRGQNESIYFFHGSNLGINTSPVILRTLDSGGVGNVKPVSPAGDVNGDGYEDILSGGMTNDKVYVYYGKGTISIIDYLNSTVYVDEALKVSGHCGSNTGEFIRNIISVIVFLIDGNVSVNNLTQLSDGNSTKEIVFSSSGSEIETINITNTSRSSNVMLTITGLNGGSGFPTNITIDVGNDGDAEWTWSGTLSGASKQFVGLNFTNEINDYLESCLQSTCQIPLNISSESAGVVRLSAIEIRYIDNVINYTVTNNSGNFSLQYTPQTSGNKTISFYTEEYSPLTAYSVGQTSKEIIIYERANISMVTGWNLISLPLSIS